MTEPPVPKDSETESDADGEMVALDVEVVDDAKPPSEPEPAPQPAPVKRSVPPRPGKRSVVPRPGQRADGNRQAPASEPPRAKPPSDPPRQGSPRPPSKPPPARAPSDPGPQKPRSDPPRAKPPSDPPRQKLPSDPVRKTPRVEMSGPIAAMPIITLGMSSRDGDSSVEVGSSGVRRSSLPPPPAQEPHEFTGLEEEVTPLRTRAPADSLVQAIPDPRPPEQSDPNLQRPSYTRPTPALGNRRRPENGTAPANTARVAQSEPAPEILPDDVVDSERDDHAEEIEPEPDSAPQHATGKDTRVVVQSRRTPVEAGPVRVPAETRQETAPEDRISENPPEVDPEDVEIHDSATLLKLPPHGQAPRVPLPLPLYARGAELAAAVQAQQTAEAPTTKRARYWWDELFGDDFLRTMDRLTEAQVKNEVSFIEESLGVQKGGIILDLACGAGRHAVELGVRGYNVVGYDLSLAMLARAADEAQDKNQKLNFLHGDMRDMGFEEMFDGVYCWSTSFGYFDDEKNQLVAQKIHRALRTGGMLLLDVANRDFVTQRQPSLVWFEGEGCVCMDEMRVDFITSRLKVKRMVILDDGRSRELDYSIRLYTLHELGRMLHDVGFKVTEVSGHPATPGVFMGADSPRLIVLAEKA